MLKSVIVQKIPKENGISEFSQKITSSEIEKQLRGEEDRNKLLKQLYTLTKAPTQKWRNLRNSLAHDIESSIIKEGDIFYNNSKKNQEICSIDGLFVQLLTFYKELQDIIDKDDELEKLHLT